MGLPGPRADQVVGRAGASAARPAVGFAKLEALYHQIINFHDREDASEINAQSKLDAIGAS